VAGDLAGRRLDLDQYRAPSVFDDPGLKLHPAHPIVFHLHGHNAAQGASIEERNQCAASLVLTEDDYYEVLLALDRPAVVPQQVRDALVGSSLLVIGYSLTDTTFRVLYRGLIAAAQKSILNRGFVVMPPPGDPAVPETLKAQQYLERYADALNLSVYWGDARTFANELSQKQAAHPRR
jgi:hypothetical protein